MALSNVKDNELEMFTFFEMTPDLVCIAGKDGFFRKVNPAVIEKLEFTTEELLARPISSFIHHEDQAVTHHRRIKLLNGQPLMNFENRYISKSGKIIWLAWTSIYFSDKEVVFAIAKDITERKHIEKEIEEKYNKFKSLANHFKISLEEDKKYFAKELHDEVAQLAAVVKLDMDWIINHDSSLSTGLKKRMEHASAISEMMIKTIRRISFSISPNMLEDLGLIATLEWYCKEFGFLNGILCKFEYDFNEEDLSTEIKLDFFRICQEALTNVIEHANASLIIIRISEDGGKITLSIKDNGIGFDMYSKPAAQGIAHMRERIASINGQLLIKSTIGIGTLVHAQISKLNLA